MQPVREVIIIGGGLAGLTAAIHLSRAGLYVTVIEKHSYPRHKVCGEYISNEVLPYLQWLDADPAVLSPAPIERVCISTVTGKKVETRLPLGGFGISRYTLDAFLMEKAVHNGVNLLQDTVTNISFVNEQFAIETVANGTLFAAQAIGAYGKRAALDQQLKREFWEKKSPWLAVKAHYRGYFPDGLVALHNFTGGYCGVSKVEDNIINVCYLVNYDTFKNYKNIDEHRKEVLYENPYLKEVFSNSEPLFDRPLTISQISFSEKKKVDQHILMTGDTAGLIHPLCGNGMAMAISSAQLAARQILQGQPRAILEKEYTRNWQKQFGKRMKAGSLLSSIFMHPWLSGMTMGTVVAMPALLPVIIRQTHGQPLTVKHNN
ncbi:NAD(P)/FAD-dependent oxidoreductase [Chitinophaga sp.]|uniref:NAD(P)/FAD-dependent oxidoreductase n=1 Tax=Chitinophaga sp. TaxID=1869181 RepID=UPI0031DF9BF5